MKFYTMSEIKENFEIAAFDLDMIYAGKRNIICKATGEKFIATEMTDGTWILKAI